jgi:hypothetical protein
LSAEIPVHHPRSTPTSRPIPSEATNFAATLARKKPSMIIVQSLDDRRAVNFSPMKSESVGTQEFIGGESQCRYFSSAFTTSATILFFQERLKFSMEVNERDRILSM